MYDKKRVSSCNSFYTTALPRCSTFRTWLGGGSKSATSGERAGTRGRGPEGAHKGEAIAAGAGTVSGGDAKLRKLGLESSIDRRRVMAVMLGEEETPSLINWFEVRVVGIRPQGRMHSRSYEP